MSADTVRASVVQPTLSPHSVPDDATEELPPESEPGETVYVREVKDPEGDHRRGIAKAKLNFAQWLVAGSVVIAVSLGVVEYFCPPRNSGMSLSGIVDMVQLLATTGLGFIFGRSVRDEK